MALHFTGYNHLHSLALTALKSETCLYKPWRPTSVFQIEITINVLVSYFCFEYLCYRSTAFVIFLYSFNAGTTYDVRI